MWLQSVQYDLQHDFAWVADEADRSLALTQEDNGTATQWDRYKMGQEHNGTDTQRDRGTLCDWNTKGPIPHRRDRVTG